MTTPRIPVVLQLFQLYCTVSPSFDVALSIVGT